MKKVIVGLLVLLALTGCVNTTGESDALKFKQEYETLNGQTNDAGVLHKSVTISEENPMIYATGNDVIEMLTSGTGIIYFGYPECPWCRAALPVLLEACDEELMMKVLYYNNKEQRDVKKLTDEGVVTEEEGTDEYYQILSLLGDYASVYDGLDDASIKRLYFPTVVFVYEGEIVGLQESLVSEDGVDPRQDLSDEQWNALKSVYKEYMKEVKGACDSSC